MSQQQLKRLRLPTLPTATSLFTAAALLFSGSALATHVNGTLKITNKTQCHLDIVQTNDSNEAIIELTNQVLKRKSTSKDILFQMDTGVYGGGNAFLNATCKAEGGADGHYFTLFIAGTAGGSFHTEADCNAAISASMEGGQGIKPGAFANLRIPALHKSTGEKTGELSVFVSRKSASGVVVSSGLSSLELCGPGNGFFRVQKPEVKPLAIHGFGEEITKGYFKPHTIVVEDVSSDTRFIEREANNAIKLQATASGNFSAYSFPVTLRNARVESLSLNKDRTFTVSVLAYANQQVPKTVDKAMRTEVIVESFDDLKNLHICASHDINRLMVTPSREFPLDNPTGNRARQKCMNFMK